MPPTQHGIPAKSRIKSTVYGAFFVVASVYVLFTLEVNSFRGFYRVIASIPLFFAFKCLLESLSSSYFIRKKDGSFNLKALSVDLALSVLVGLVCVFI